MSKSKILLGSNAFKESVELVAKKATKSFFVQAMTFEGDDAGKWLISVMKSSPAKEKKILIDSYSKVVINDQFIFSTKYWSDKEFRKEVLNTKTLIKEAIEAGIEVKFTNPVGWVGQKYPLRNHKKMVIIDEQYCYLGGINFSDHNFSWHDMMISLDSLDLGNRLGNDFRETQKDNNQSKEIETDKGVLYLLNGIKSKGIYDSLFKRISSAKQSVEVISPYISEPLLNVLKLTASKGVQITIITPKVNNKSIFKNLILAEKDKGYFQLKEYPGMSHMKAVLIDGEELLFGSSNYDLISYYFEQEVVLCSKDTGIITQFQNLVLKDVQKYSEDESISKWSVRKASIIMSLVNGFGKVASKSFLRPR
ncbi:MAG: phosphatidylserine/phosphatidylglycerophosphate/cardiolipin synthase family protein [Ekhidna sp.]